jgi:hypothetical protein
VAASATSAARAFRACRLDAEGRHGEHAPEQLVADGTAE